MGSYLRVLRRAPITAVARRRSVVLTCAVGAASSVLIVLAFREQLAELLHYPIRGAGSVDVLIGIAAAITAPTSLALQAARNRRRGRG